MKSDFEVPQSVKDKYRGRVVDTEINDMLEVFGGVLILGPKWCGKSWTGMYHSNSVVLADDDRIRKMADLYPEEVLNGKYPRLIDEWQNAPILWDKARREIDFGVDKGRFIFTGSITPPKEKMAHSGVGRFARLFMRPMSLYEYGQSSGVVSLAKMLDGTEVYNGVSSVSPKDIITLICRGGWPAGIDLDDEKAMRIPSNYIDQIINSDFSDQYGETLKSRNINRVIRSVARNIATEARISTLASDISSDDEKISEQTVSKYLEIMKETYVIVEQEAWMPDIRSTGRIRTSPKRHFVDPSLAVAALKTTPGALVKDPKYLGFLFESLCFRDLSVYAGASNGNVYHYRDKEGLEIDAVIEARDGKWGAAEVKMGSMSIDVAAKNLIRFREKVGKDAEEPPAFLAVLTASSGGAYVREDGVAVIPIDCLGP